MAVKPTPGAMFGNRVRELRQTARPHGRSTSPNASTSRKAASARSKAVSAPESRDDLRLAVALECKPSALISVFDGQIWGRSYRSEFESNGAKGSTVRPTYVLVTFA